MCEAPGHSVDDVSGDQLDVPGGMYDQAPFTHPDAVEREYTKLEPYLNIYTGKTAHVELESKEELDEMRQQLSSLTSEVAQLTEHLNLKTGSNFQTSKIIETKSVKKMQAEGLIFEK